MPVKSVNLTTPVKEINLKAMTMDELKSLRSDIAREVERREKKEYDKAVADFRSALYKLYSEFGDECCLINHDQGDYNYKTWKDLHNDYDWNF